MMKMLPNAKFNTQILRNERRKKNEENLARKNDVEK